MNLLVKSTNQIEDEYFGINVTDGSKVKVKAEPSLAAQIEFANRRATFECQVLEQAMVSQNTQHIGQNNLALSNVKIDTGISSISLCQPLLDH
jgi:hypothetical protein